MRGTNLKSAGYEFEYYFIHLKEEYEINILSPIFPLIKEFTLISEADIFPGLTGSKIPKNALISPHTFELLDRKRLYMFRLQLRFFNWSEDLIV